MRSRSAGACARRASSARAGRATSRTGRARRRATSAGSGAARRAPGRSCRRSRRSRPNGRRGTSSSSARRCRRRARAAAGGRASRRCCRRRGSRRPRARPRRRPGCRRCSGAGSSAISIQTMRVRSSRCAASLVELVSRNVGEAIPLRLVDLRGHPVDAAVDVVHADDALARDRRGASGSSSLRGPMRRRSRARRPRGSPGSPGAVRVGFATRA